MSRLFGVLAALALAACTATGPGVAPTPSQAAPSASTAPPTPSQAAPSATAEGSHAAPSPTAWASHAAPNPTAPPCPQFEATLIDDFVSARIPIAREGTGEAPWGLSAGEGSVWVANRGVELGTVMRVDPRTNRVEATVELPAKQRGGPVFALGAGWVGTQSALVRIDSETHELSTVLETDVENLGVFGDQLWITLPEAVVRIDPETGDELARIKLEGAVWPGEVAIDETGVWVADGDFAVWHVDPSVGEVVARIPLENGPSTIRIADGAIWTGGWGADSDPGEGGCSAIYRIDPTTHEVAARILVGATGSRQFTLHDGYVWSRPRPDVLLKIDPDTAEVVEAYDGLPPAEYASSVLSAEGSLWVANWSDGSVWRIDP